MMKFQKIQNFLFCSQTFVLLQGIFQQMMFISAIEMYILV